MIPRRGAADICFEGVMVAINGWNEKLNMDGFWIPMDGDEARD